MMKVFENAPEIPEILYADRDLLVCVKPAGILSTNEPGGLPELIRQELGDEDSQLRTVHRLDRMAGGLMVLARSAEAASLLSQQIRQGSFEKEYCAVVHGNTPDKACLRDLMLRDKARRMSFVVEKPAKGVQEAVLHFHTLWRHADMSCVRIALETGRTHQIRVQFASRGWPLVGDRKYSERPADCPLALFSCCVAFTHPMSGKRFRFEHDPPGCWPWNVCE